MSSKATLFLIDGSNQMYRAYHAIRGLTGPDGKSTNAVYGFVTMLRKLLADHQPAYIAASFDLPGPTFRDPMVGRLQGESRGDARRSRRADAAGPRSVRGAGRAGHHVRGLRGRRRDRARWRACAVQEGYDVAIVTGDKDFFQLVDDRIRVFNPRDEGTWYDADGVREKWGVAPEQVVDVLALMGDAIDNIKGVPGHRREGRQGSDRHLGHPRRAARTRGEVPQKRYREALLAHAEDARQSRELLRFRTRRAVRVRDRRVPIPRRLARAVLRAVLAPRLPLAGDGVRADGGDD